MVFFGSALRRHYQRPWAEPVKNYYFGIKVISSQGQGAPVALDFPQGWLHFSAKGASPPARYQNVLEPLLPSTTAGKIFGRLSAPGTSAK